MSPPLTHDHKHCSSVLPLLLCYPSLQQWDTWFPPAANHWLHCSIQHICMVVSNCCPVPVRGTTSPTRAQCLQTISPAFALTGWVHFQSYLGQYLLSCPSGSWSHRFVIQLDYFITVCISSWIPHPPRWLLKFACMKIHSLCCKVLA